MDGEGFGVPSLLDPAWSISTEVAAYLLFPFLLLLTMFSSRVHAVGALVAATLLLFLSTKAVTQTALPMMHGSLDVWDDATIGPLLRCIGGFTIGLLTFRAARSPRLRAIASSDVFGFAVLALLAGGMAWSVDDLVLYPLFPALVLSLYVNRRWLARIAGARPLHWLGVLSYAIYLVHTLIIEILWPASQSWFEGYSAGLRGAASTVLCVAATLLFAHLLHLAVEKPGRTWVRRFEWQPPTTKPI